ncbi:MAG: glycerate kinase [Dehalococcoidia bacterium]|nr:glycerate kinase [Dehalococcoidia bacterium]
MQALTRLRDTAIGPSRLVYDILAAALVAVDPYAAVRRALAESPLPANARVYVVGAGKAGVGMARAAHDVLGERIVAGCVAVPDSAPSAIGRIALAQASHPVPDARGMAAAQRVAEMARAAQSNDVVLCLFSGGGSALLPLPVEGVSLEDKQGATGLLLRSGATIHEVNAVRKHLSRLKGGQLARLASRARVLGLYISDVSGDRLESIASGPTSPDSTTYADALRALERYGLLAQSPRAVVERLRLGITGGVPETPKGGEPFWARVHNVIVASGRDGLAAAGCRVEALGLRVHVLPEMSGEAREVGARLGALVRRIARDDGPVRRPACLLAAGETTVVVRGAGKGGRNQELALAAAAEMDGLDGVALASFATDGVDGPTDAAGAMVDGATLVRARSRGLAPDRYLADNDAYRFFDDVGGLIRTGPTGTNVADIVVACVV